MFQYVKTLGSHVGAPEIEYMPIRNSFAIETGCLCEMSSGVLASDYTENKDKSKFITLEKKTAGDGKTKIKCIRVLPGMLISVDYEGEIGNIDIGSFVCPTSDIDGHYVCCSEDYNGKFEVVDKSEFSTTGKITIIIHL